MNVSVVISMFVEGLVSFFSPCIIPVLPLYLGYLASGAKSKDENGNVVYNRLKVFVTTCFFVLGISFAILLLGVSVSVFNNVFSDYSLIISFVGSFLLIIFGLYTLGVIRVPLFERERRIGVNLSLNRLSYIQALAFGFLFSFSWTPCVGPYLTSAVIMASDQGSLLNGVIYIFIYILGFVIPFLLLGLFVEEFIGFINKKKAILKYVNIVGGVVLCLMGGYMFIRCSNEVMSNKRELKRYQDAGYTVYDNDKQKYDFSLVNSNGDAVTLSEMVGENVCITFFRTWCTYCKQEISDLTLLKKEYPDVRFVIVTSPNVDNETDEDGIRAYLEELGCDVELLFDYDMVLCSRYGVSGYPMTFMFDDEDKFYGYIPGYLPLDDMRECLDNFTGKTDD